MLPITLFQHHEGQSHRHLERYMIYYLPFFTYLQLGFFTAGSRVPIDRTITQQLLADGSNRLHHSALYATVVFLIWKLYSYV